MFVTNLGDIRADLKGLCAIPDGFIDVNLRTGPYQSDPNKDTRDQSTLGTLQVRTPAVLLIAPFDLGWAPCLLDVFF